MGRGEMKIKGRSSKINPVGSLHRKGGSRKAMFGR